MTMPDKNGGQNGKPERDANGKFVKGNGGGPGRPKKDNCISDLMAEYLKRETVAPMKDSLGRKRKGKTTFLRLFVESQIARAINGDAAAAKNVWERIEGRIPDALEITTGDAGFDMTVHFVKAKESDE